MSIEAMKQLVEALELYETKTDGMVNKALAVGRQAIAEAEKQEPVAFVDRKFGASCVGWHKSELPPDGTQLYTSPPTQQSCSQRQPLTDEQIDQAIEQVENEVGGTTNAWDMVPPRKLVRSILKAAHGIKGEA